jgi:hypothetical protein
MAKLRKTSATLMLRDSDLLAWAAGALFTLTGLLALASGEKTTLNCSQSHEIIGRCQLTQSGFLSTVSKDIPLAELQEASVDVASNHKSGWKYRVLLHTLRGTLPLSQTYTQGRQEKEAIAAQINHFIATPNQSSLNVQQDYRFYYALVGSLFLGAGVISFLCGRIRTCWLDQAKNQLRFRQLGLVGRQYTECPLGEILSVELESHTREYKGKSTFSHRIILYLSSNERLILTPYMANTENVKTILQEITDFLDLPLKT